MNKSELVAKIAEGAELTKVSGRKGAQQLSLLQPQPLSKPATKSLSSVSAHSAR